MTAQDYIAKYWLSAATAAQGTGLFPSIFLAQAGLEGGWGKSELAWKFNNHFGVKANGGWQGRTVKMPTREYIGGQWVTINDAFRVYGNAYESFRDRIKFLLENPRYRANGVFDAKTPFQQADALQRAGYATDPGYAQKLKDIIRQQGLEKYDNAPIKSQGATLAVVGAIALGAAALGIHYKYIKL